MKENILNLAKINTQKMLISSTVKSPYKPNQIRQTFIRKNSSNKHHAILTTNKICKFASLRTVIPIIILLVLCNGVKEANCKKRHLCGSRLIDGLRFLCGARGFNSPVLQEGRFGLWTPHNSHRPYITEICCNQGCSLKQLEQFCDLPGHTMNSRQRLVLGRRRNRKKGKNKSKSSNNNVINSTTSTTERSLTSIRPTAALTTHQIITPTLPSNKTNLSKLEARYYSLIKQERASGSSGRSVLLDIIKTAAKLYHELEFNERTGSGAYEGEYNSGSVKVHFATVNQGAIERPKRAHWDH